MNHCMTGCAIPLQKCFLVMRTTCRTVRKLFRDSTVAFETELADLMPFKQSRICRTMRNVTRCAALDLERSVLKDKRTLFVGVAPDTGSFASD